jgi:tetratricopeptide (TPR) repeat protein
VELANTLHELANTHFYTGRHDRSQALNLRALDIYRRLFGPQHPHVADTLINLGAIEFERGDFAASERLFREGLAITEAWHGPDHFRTANNLTMLGRTLVRLDRHPEAEAVLVRALAGRERAYGPQHSSVASTLNELGTIARKQKRFDDAEAYYQRMAAIYRAVYADSEHWLLAVAISNIGTVEHERGHLESARTLLREAHGIFSRTLPADHSNVGIVQVKLAITDLASGRYEDALREASAGYAILQKTMKPGATWLVDAEKTLAAAREAIADPNAASGL